MKRIVLLVLIIALFILCVGCSQNKTDELEVEENQNIEDVFKNNNTSSVVAQFGFGFISENFSERQVYKYNGEEICIPYYVKGMEEGLKADFGLILFVDGVSQPYKIRQNGETSEEQFMHKFSLANNEKKEFDIVFSPVTVKNEERVSIIPATILKPEFIPESESKPIYGIYHSLSANTPNEIYFKSGITNSRELCGYSKYSLDDIPESLKDNNMGAEVNSADGLDKMTKLELLPEYEEENIIYSNNGKVKFKLRMYGGPELTYNTTIFVNHKPVQIMNSDYLETKTQKGKMCTFDIELDISNYERLNTIYAISNPSGKGYFAEINFPIKTKSILMVNDLKKSSIQDKQQESIEDKTLSSTGSKYNSQKEDNNDLTYLAVDYKSNCMVLKEYEKPSILKKIPLDKNSFVEKIHEFDKGYILNIAYADKPVEFIEKLDIELIKFPENINYRLIKIYDKNLNFQKEIKLKDIYPNKSNYDYKAIVSNQAVSQDGKEIIWTSSQNLYMYEVETGKTRMILDKTNNNIGFRKVHFAGNSIVFEGCKVNEENDIYYGVFEPESMKMEVFVERNFNCSRIRISEKHAVFEENTDPMKSSSGRVLVIDLQNKKNFKMQLDGEESNMAKATDDGKYLIAVRQQTKGSCRIRQYKLKTNEVIYEEIVNSEVSCPFDILSIDVPSTYLIVFPRENEEFMVYKYICKEE